MAVLPTKPKTRLMRYDFARVLNPKYLFKVLENPYNLNESQTIFVCWLIPCFTSHSTAYEHMKTGQRFKCHGEVLDQTFFGNGQERLLIIIVVFMHVSNHFSYVNTDGIFPSVFR